MTQTFTLDLDFTAQETEKDQKRSFLDIADPSETTIQNILNYSKNLEVKQSGFIKNIEIIKS